VEPISDLDELVMGSEIMTIHAPPTPETGHLLNQERPWIWSETHARWTREGRDGGCGAPPAARGGGSSASRPSTSSTLNQPQIIQILGFENVILTLYIVHHGTASHVPQMNILSPSHW